MRPLPVTRAGNKYILVVTDLFTKWVEAFPLKETSAKSLATVLVNEFICRFGILESLHGDQGRNFCGHLIQSICDILGIKLTNTSAYHPQGNGQMEQFNRTIEAMHAKLIQDDPQDWDIHISKTLFAY